MGKIFKALAMATAVCWPATVLAASDGDVPGRGMSKAEVRAQFGQPRHTRPAVGQPPITRWDYDGFSVYFENDTTLHSVREKQRAPAAEPSPAGGAPGEQPQTHSTLEAEVGVSPANGEEPPTEKEEQETNIEVETFEPPRNKEEEDDETSTESDSAPGSTAVRANAEGSEERSEEDTERDARENTDDGASDEGRFRFDPATGRIVVDDPQEDEDSDASPAR
ncbi:MAG: hypothetical protein RH947_03600 [Alcanivorax sp.]|jgi:hypothetical protein